MTYFTYDGSFEGLLTLIHEAFYREETPDKIEKEKNFNQNLFSKKIYIETDPEKSDKVYNAIQNKISSQSLKNIYQAFLSEKKGIENYIFKYIKIGFKMGKKVDSHLIQNDIYKVKKISKKVGKEKHRLKGLLRFRKLKNNIFYAPVEPEYNSIVLLIPHFKKRLSHQNWIIHDKKRELAVLYNQKESVITELKDFKMELDSEEEFYQKLWKDFFDNIGIKNRKNPEVQRQYMPQKYWKYLVENVEKE